MRFPKAAELNFSTKIFRVAKVIERRPRAVYELVGLNGTPIDGQFYGEELSPVRIMDRTVYKMDKILDKGGQSRHSRISRPLVILQSGLRLLGAFT